MKKLLLFLAVTAFLHSTKVQNDAPTIEQIMSAPFPTNLTAAPAGTAFAWVFNDQGVRNIWYVPAAGERPRALTGYTRDDGQEITDLTFTPDGRTLLFVRGGAPNRRGEIPNPTSDPEGATRAIYRVSVNGGTISKVVDGSTPTLAPDGKTLAYSGRGGAWIIDISTSDAQPQQLFSARGGVSSMRWAPGAGNRKLAFVSNRGTHAYIGVYNWPVNDLQFLCPTVDQDANPVWSPDGNQLAFGRFPQESGLLPFFARRSGLPWSIWVADVNLGECRQVWKAGEGHGSVFRSVSGEQLYWTQDGHLVFPWEGDGWTHLYAVPAAGGQARCLTPGEFEVQFVSLGADGNTILYSGNQDDIDRQHVWRVTASGAPQRVTPGAGIEWAPVMAADGITIGALASGPRTPAHPIFIRNGKREMLAPGQMPADYPSDQLVDPQQVIFPASDGMQVHGQLFVPKDLKEGDRRPAILFFHGGSRRQMLLGFHHRGYYHNTYAMNQYLAGQGYIVLSVNYRSGIGYGMEFREAVNYGAEGASEFNDVMGAGLFLKQHPLVDPDRIGLWGGSYGGYLTALGLARASHLFKAGVDFHGVHDWNVVIQNFAPSYNPNDDPARTRLAFESSPMSSIDTWTSPVLLIHGDDDRNVPFSESVDLAESLRKQGIYFEQLVFPDEVHGFLLHRNWIKAYEATKDFFDRKLK